MKQNSHTLLPSLTGKAVNNFLLFLMGAAAFFTSGNSDDVDPVSILAIFGGANLKAPVDFRLTGDFVFPFFEDGDPPLATEWAEGVDRGALDCCCNMEAGLPLTFSLVDERGCEDGIMSDCDPCCVC